MVTARVISYGTQSAIGVVGKSRLGWYLPRVLTSLSSRLRLKEFESITGESGEYN